MQKDLRVFLYYIRTQMSNLKSRWLPASVLMMTAVVRILR